MTHSSLWLWFFFGNFHVTWFCHQNDVISSHFFYYCLSFGWSSQKNSPCWNSRIQLVAEFRNRHPTFWLQSPKKHQAKRKKQTFCPLTQLRWIGLVHKCQPPKISRGSSRYRTRRIFDHVFSLNGNQPNSSEEGDSSQTGRGPWLFKTPKRPPHIVILYFSITVLWCNMHTVIQ